MNKNDLKREHGLLDDSNQTQPDAKISHLESDHQCESLSVHENCHTVKGFSFVEKCQEIANRSIETEIALKYLKTMKDFSSPGKNCLCFIFVKFLLSSLFNRKNVMNGKLRLIITKKPFINYKTKF